MRKCGIRCGVIPMLNLPKLQQTKLVETAGQYEVHVTADCPAPACGCLAPKIVKNGTKQAMFFDTPMHGKKVGIIIADRFHIMQHASQGVERVRKQLRASLNFNKRIGLIGDRWLFLSAREKLSADQTMVLEAVLEQYPTIKEAYHLKEAFRDVWLVTARADAEARYADWLKRVEASNVSEAFKPLTTALVNWREEAFNYLDVRLTNAYTEGMNGLARRMDRNGRGYSFPVLRAKLLMMYSAHKRAAPTPFVRSRALPQGMMGFGVALPSTCEDEANTFLGLDISTLADEVAKWPSN